jgi:HK97 gp10 family phage protein
MIKWFADDVLDVTHSVVEAVSKDVAEDVVEDAKRILKQKAKKLSEKGLMTQFSITKSKFKNGGYLVNSQGPKLWRKPYHASFVELGTYKDEPKPYMRPAAKKNERKAQRKYRDELEKKYKRTK